MELQKYGPCLAMLIHEARKKAPYYTQLYSQVPPGGPMKLVDLPLVNHTEYWVAYDTSEQLVWTRQQSDGIVMKTGGTTSNPKFTSYSQSELLRTASLLATGLLQAGLQAGDRVGNLFYAGDMYGSFLLHILSLISLPVPAVQIPIGGLASPESTTQLLEVCRVTVLLSTASSLVRLASYCQTLDKRFDRVSKVMFGGEPMFADQENMLRDTFPNAIFRSCIYGSIDAGVIAVSTGKTDSRVYRTLPHATVTEILPEDGDMTAPGALVVTNLIRELSPIIRYPTGDRAEWVDDGAGVFRLLGRHNVAVRLGPVSLDASHLRQMAQAVLEDILIKAFQLLVMRKEGKDALIITIDPSRSPPEGSESAIISLLGEQRPMYKEHVALGLIARATVVFKPIGRMILTKHSGKLPEVVDMRE